MKGQDEVSKGVENDLDNIKLEQGAKQRDVSAMKEHQIFQDNFRWKEELGKVKNDLKKMLVQ